MKILMLSPFYPPIIGGMELHVKSLAEWLVRRGHEVVVCTLGPNTISVGENISIYRISGAYQNISILFKDVKRKTHPPLPDPLLIKKIKKVIKDERPDIIHAHGWMLYSAISLKKEFNIPIVATIHDYGYICPKKTLMDGNSICYDHFTSKCIQCGRKEFGFIKSLLRYAGVKSQKDALNYVDKFIAVSSFVRNVHLGYIDEDRIIVIPNFYTSEFELEHNTDKTDQIESNTMFSDNFILYVGKFSYIKGVQILLEAFSKIDHDVKLLIIGSEADLNIEKCIEKYKRKINVYVLKNAPRSVVIQAYSKCKFVVVPSIWPDPCPTVALEAMCHKKAIIASKIGGLLDIVKNCRTGLLVPPNDSDSLSTSIMYLLDNPLKAKKFGKMGYNTFINTFTAERVIPRIEKIYNSLAR